MKRSGLKYSAYGQHPDSELPARRRPGGENPEETIANIGRLGKQGLKHTNEEIIKIMVGE